MDHHLVLKREAAPIEARTQSKVFEYFAPIFPVILLLENLIKKMYE